MSLPLSSLIGFHHAKGHPDASSSVLAALDDNQERNRKLALTRTRRLGGGAGFVGLDSLSRIAAENSERHHCQERKQLPAKLDLPKENKIKSNIGGGWSSSSLLTGISLAEQPALVQRRKAFDSALVTAISSREERKPIHRSSKHVHFGSSLLGNPVSSNEGNDKHVVTRKQETFRSSRETCSQVNLPLLVQVSNHRPCNKDDVVPKERALPRAYTAAGRTYKSRPVHAKRAIGQNIPRRVLTEESVLLLASSVDDIKDDNSNRSSQVDDQFLSLFHTQATLDDVSPHQGTCTFLDDPLNKRSLFASPSLTLHRQIKRRDGKKTPMGKVSYSDSALKSKDEDLVKRTSEDIRVETSSFNVMDDDTASSLSDESMTERWGQTSIHSSASSPEAIIPSAAPAWICSDNEQVETLPHRIESPFKDLTFSQIPDSPHLLDLDTKHDDNIFRNEVQLLPETKEDANDMDCWSPPSLSNDDDSKSVKSNGVDDSVKEVNATSVDVSYNKSSSSNKIIPDEPQNAIRRSRRVRVATDRYMPNDVSKGGVVVSMDDPSNLIQPFHTTNSNEQLSDILPSKSKQRKENAETKLRRRKSNKEAISSTASSSLLEKKSVDTVDPATETDQSIAKLVGSDIQSQSNPLIEPKPIRDRKKTDFFHNNIYIQEQALAKAPTLLTDSAVPVENQSTANMVHPPKTVNVSSIILEADVWTDEQLQQLHDARLQVDPTSSSFWSDVAQIVSMKTASECQSQWFSLSKTPAPKSRQNHFKLKMHKEDENENEDDIFHSTPMRDGILPGSLMPHLPSMNVFNALPPIPRNSMITEKFQNAESNEGTVHERAKPFSKAFLQRMRRDHVKAEKESHVGQKWNKSSLGGKNTHVLTEAIRDSEMDINIRLTPGGTLKVKSHVEDDDFWDEAYGNEDDESVTENHQW